jgi:type III restriction enzyme
LDDVDVWVRNLANHADAFRLTMHNGGKYYPDFIAKLNDGRIFVVEYKGSQGTDR